MATNRKIGSVSVQSHHAFNAVSAAIQVAIQSTCALATELQLEGKPRWKRAWEAGRTPVSYWLVGSPLWDEVAATWSGKFDEQLALAEAADEEIKNQEAPSLLDLP